MKLLYKAGDITEAHIVKGLLESNDVEAHVGGYYLQGGIGEIAATDFATIHVADDDYEKARKIISEYEGIEPQTPKAHASRHTSFITRLMLVIVATVFVVFLYYLISL